MNGPILSEASRQLARRITLVARRRAPGSLSGSFVSSFRGSGLEFAEVREYQDGDDIRSLDGHVSARMGRPFVKRFEEEREQTLLILADVSASTTGDFQPRPRDRIVQISGILGLTAVAAGDRVGAVLFGGKSAQVYPTRSTVRSVESLVAGIQAARQDLVGGSLADTLEQVRGRYRRPALVVVLSDFEGAEFDGPLQQLARRHEVMGVWVRPPLEILQQAGARLSLQNPEGGDRVEVDAGSASVQRWLQQSLQQQRSRLQDRFARARARLLEVPAEQSLESTLVPFFRPGPQGRWA